MDLYKVLGVTREATREEVKRAFRQVALQFHPDRHAQASVQQQQTAARRFREASEAYQVLIDPLKRSLYNRQGRAAPSSPPPNYHRPRQPFHASSRPHRPPSTLHLSLSPLDVAFHALFAGTLIIGLFFGDSIGKAIWEGRNAESFEHLVEAKQHREKERKG